MEQKILPPDKGQSQYDWRQSFYKAYKKKDYVEAERIYLLREKFHNGISDVHTAYKLEKKLDQGHAVMVLASAFFIILCLLGLTECVS